MSQLKGEITLFQKRITFLFYQKSRWKCSDVLNLKYLFQFKLYTM